MVIARDPDMTWTEHLTLLRSNAHSVLTNERPATGLAPREVARILAGVTGTIVRRHGVAAMQQACALLVLDTKAIPSGLTILPRDNVAGRVDPSVAMVAMVARGLLGASSPVAVRAALSFWASESDPGVWQTVVAAA